MHILQMIGARPCLVLLQQPNPLPKCCQLQLPLLLLKRADRLYIALLMVLDNGITGNTTRAEQKYAADEKSGNQARPLWPGSLPRMWSKEMTHVLFPSIELQQ